MKAPTAPRGGYVMRRVSTLGFIVAGALMTGCSSTPWWEHPGATSCGPPALARVAGHVMNVGSCDGSFWLPVPKVTLRVGTAIDLHMTEQGTGPTGNQLAPASPLPYVSGTSALERTVTDSGKATATYKAVHPGGVVLITRGRCILDGHSRPSCPVIDVTVIP
jgi:hypothetical protein